MERFTNLWLRLKALALRRRLERDLDDELSLHLALRAEKLGGPAAARRAFGNPAAIREQCRDQWTFAWLEAMGQDLRYALRQLRRDPAYTATCAITLALGIGAVTSVYTMFDAVLWRSLPLPQATRMVSVLQADPANPHFAAALAPGDLQQIRDSAASLQGLTGWQNVQASIVDAGGEAVRVEASRVLANFFEVTGIRPALGRGFEPAEFEPGADLVAVISDDLWRRHFAADPHITGRTVRIDRRNYTVTGVMPPKFKFPRGWRDLWMPLALSAEERRARNITLIETAGRLKPGRSLGNLASEIATLGVRMEKENPATNRGRRFAVWTLERAMTGDYLPVYVAMLFAGAMFVLLICCANVANLQFARATGRQREMRVRAALGAGRARLVRQLLTESMVPAAAGALLGLAAAQWSLAVIKYSVPLEMRHYLTGWADIRLNTAALAITLGATVLSGAVSGLAPAWRSSRRLWQSRFAPPGRHRLGSLLAGAQIALALVLLTGAGLTVRGFRALMGGEREREPESLLTVRLVLSPEQYREDRQVTGFYDAVLERIRAVPGVRAACAVQSLPYSRHGSAQPLAVENAAAPGDLPSSVRVQAASPEYFQVLRIPLIAGQGWEASAQAQAVVTAYTARRWWPGQSALGRRIRLGGPGRPWIPVTGVVADIPYSALDRGPHPMVYLPYTQLPERDMNLAIRATAPLALAQAVTAAVRAVDREQPVDNIATLEELGHQEAFGFRYLAWLMGIFGGLALLLAAIGVYGVMAYTVSQQTHEIGVRLALGARPAGVLRMVAGRGLRTALCGLLAGLLPAYGIARVAAFVFFSEKSRDAAPLLAPPVCLLAASLLAVLPAAHRAMRTDPVRALRES